MTGRSGQLRDINQPFATEGFNDNSSNRKVQPAMKRNDKLFPAIS